MLTPTERQAIIDAIDAGTYDLADALLEIATKQKGEDVRKAIYGGILLANDSGEGAVDPKARELIALNKSTLSKEITAMQKQMAAFIANNSGTTKSTKRDVTVISDTESTISSVVSLDIQLDTGNSINNYDYIEFQCAAAGRTQIIQVTPAQLRGTVHWSVTKYDPVEINATHTNFINFVFQAVSNSNDVISLLGYKYVWDGDASSSGIANSVASGDGMKIMSVRGIKYTTVDTTTKDAELTDLRVGYDDTEYDSAGEAIRAQISALWAAVNAINIAEPTIDNNGYLRFDTGGE